MHSEKLDKAIPLPSSSPRQAPHPEPRVGIQHLDIWTLERRVRPLTSKKKKNLKSRMKVLLSPFFFILGWEEGLCSLDQAARGMNKRKLATTALAVPGRGDDTPPSYTNPTASWSQVRILPLSCLLQTKRRFVKSPTAAQSFLRFGGGKVGGGRRRDREGPQQCRCTTHILHKRAQPCSLAATLVLQGPPPPTCKCTVRSDSAVQAMGWVPPILSARGKKSSPICKGRKLHRQEHRQSLAASSHGRAFYLTAASMKPTVAIYLNNILKSSRRFQRSKDKTTVSSPGQRQIHSYFPSF